MKRILEWCKGIQKSLIWILCIVFIIVLIVDIFVKPHIEEGTYIYNLTSFIYTLGLSYIASFIFYFVQVHLKEVKEKKRVLPSIERFFQRLVFYENEVVFDTIQSINPEKKIGSFQDITKDEFLSSTQMIRLDLNSSIFQGVHELNWLEYYSYRRNQIEEYVRLILDYSQYLEEDGISLLADIRNDSFLFTIITNARSCKDSGLNYAFTLGSLKNFCEDYYDLVKRTNEYYTRVLKPFQESEDKIIRAIYIRDKKQIVI